MLAALCLIGLAGLLVTGALTDIECRRLPNWLTSAVAILYSIFVIVSLTPVDWMSACLVAALVFAVGFVGFAFQFLGGGDVKLMSGLALWAGPEHIALFLIVTSIAGGLLAAFMMAFHRWAKSPLALFFAPFSELILKKLPGPTALAASSTPDDAVQSAPASSLPYGVAIAAGGFAVIFGLQQL